MLAKVIVHADDRAAALEELADALAQTEVLGLRTNLPFLRMLAADDTVRAGQVTTTWLESAYAGWTSGVDDAPVPEPAVALAGAAEAARILSRRGGVDPWSAAGPWRHLEPGPTHVVVQVPTGPDESGVTPDSPRLGGERLVDVRGTGPFRVGDHEIVQADAAHEPDGDRHGWSVDGTRAAAVPAPGLVHVYWDGQPYELPLGIKPRLVDAEGGAAQLGSPMPGTVIAVKVSRRRRRRTGPDPGGGRGHEDGARGESRRRRHVSAVLCTAGESVKKGQPLVALETAAE